MIENLALRWGLTAAFGLAGVVSLLVVAAIGASARERAEHVVHVLMAAAMVAMAWPWGLSLPVWPQVVLFVGAGIWFGGYAMALGLAGSRVPYAPAAPLGHAVGMVAMAWMVLAMAVHHHDRGHLAGHGEHVVTGPPWPVRIPSLVLGVATAVVAGCWLLRAAWLLRRRPERDAGRLPAGHAGGHAIAHAGMAVMLFAM